jgi:hypothetical protein
MRVETDINHSILINLLVATLSVLFRPQIDIITREAQTF